MAISPSSRPRIPGNFYIRSEPPDASGDEFLVFDSELRKIKLKGRLFREFVHSVVPLLDGTRTVVEIQAEVADLFAAEDLAKCFGLLAEHRLLQDARLDTTPDHVRLELAPQLNFFHELELEPHEVQRKLGAATVAVWGLGGPGASVAMTLAASGVGGLLCIDALPVSRTDPHLIPTFTPAEVGRNRAEVIRANVAERFPRVQAVAFSGPIADDVDALRIVNEVNFIVCCADAGMATYAYILNRACLKARVPWSSCTVSGFEGVVGPTVVPHKTACYLCYKVRAVACSANPEDELAHLRRLDRRKRDDSQRRENHSFGVGAIGHLMGLEAVKCLTGIARPSALGRIVVLDFLTLACRSHTVLRMPWCPACSPTAGVENGTAGVDGP
jgi:adenylyltransferase/sulfurtransferase